MSNFLTESENVIEALHDCILMVVMKVMEHAGKPVANGFGITLHLVDMLPTIPIHLALPLIYTSADWIGTRSLCCLA